MLTDSCVNCGKSLEWQGAIRICRSCNTTLPAEVAPFIAVVDDDEHVFIECPGATVYEPGSNVVKEGVWFVDDDDPSKGYTVIRHRVYAPTHTRRRRIKREAVGRIRRCQACQDYTIRMRRPEGVDFVIPSVRFPKRTKLKSITPRHSS